VNYKNVQRASRSAGIAQGAANVHEYESTRVDRNAAREEAKMMNKQRSNILEQYEMRSAAGVHEAQVADELKALQNNMYVMQAKDMENRSFGAMRQWGTDVSNTGPLNQFLEYAKSQPMGSPYKDTTGYEPLRPEDIAAAKKKMIQDGASNKEIIAQFADINQATGRFVMANKIDAKGMAYREVIDMDKFKIASGYALWLSKEERERLGMDLSKDPKYSGLLLAAERISENPEEARGRSFEEVYADLVNARATGGTEFERWAHGDAARGMTGWLQLPENEGMNVEDALQAWKALKRNPTAKEYFGTLESRVKANDPTLTQEEKNKYESMRANRDQDLATAGQKDLAAVDEAKTALDELAGGDFFDPEFLATAKDNPRMRAEISRHMSRLTKLGGLDIDATSKREFRKLKKLVMLGGLAGEELDDDSTGAADSILKNVKKYFTDDTNNVRGVASYETFRNIFRNALMGSALTANETTLFTSSAGSLKQQLGPVLDQLVVQMETLKSDLEGIRDTEDPYISSWYVGMDTERADEIIENIETRLQEIEDLRGGAGGQSSSNMANKVVTKRTPGTVPIQNVKQVEPPISEGQGAPEETLKTIWR